MEIVTKIAPLALAFIMLGLGLGLSIKIKELKDLTRSSIIIGLIFSLGILLVGIVVVPILS